MYKQKIEKVLQEAVKSVGFKIAGDIVLSIPENPKLGDYSSNVALQLAKQKSGNSYHSPQEVANSIVEKLGHPEFLERIEVAGPGFINFFLKDQALVKSLESKVQSPEKQNKNVKRTLVEYAHPNTHKAFHIGHFRNITTGESVSRLLEFQGDEVFRVTYGGDIGPHVAKAIWGVLELKEEYKKVKSGTSLREKAEFLGKAYALGSQKYEEDERSKKEIDEINKKIYGMDPNLKPLWEETKKWSMAYFDSIYSRLGTEFDAEIWESDIQELGSLIVEENLGTVFEKDQGAIIFPGEKYGLHNRVFITGAGYPTYEGKEMGLTRRETEIFPYDQSLHIVANEQESFFQVTTKAIELVDPILTGKKKHISYGMVNLSTGKMSSRKGGVITAESLIDQVKEEIKGSFPASKQLDDQTLEKIAIAAIKFFFLKYSLKSDIAFDVEASVSLQGDTGPYLLYTYARIASLREKATGDRKQVTGEAEVNEEERNILRQLEYFELAAEQAAKNFQPNELGVYLLNLAKAFNSLYEKYQILGVKEESFRLALASKVADILKLGLYLLGIETLERM